MIIAKVIDLQSCDNLHIVKFEFLGKVLTMMSLELDSNVKVGTQVLLNIKPTCVTIAKNITNLQISNSNLIKSQISSISIGKLLSYLVLKIEENDVLESIITKESALRLNLKNDDEVIALIKASDISIAKVIS